MQKKKILIIGSGHGAQSILAGLVGKKNIDLSVIISMFDSGGSTGKLREEFDIPAVGDFRKCLIALAGIDKTSTMFKELLSIRFEEGDLKGHSLGNLLLVGLIKTSKNIEAALLKAQELIKARGKIYPSSLENAHIVAKFENGKIVEGESLIDLPQKDHRNPKLHIENLYSKPKAKAYPPALQAIKEADLIIIGPGDLYTSIIANFTVQGISEALVKSKAKKVYVCNILTKPGETYGMAASNHLKEILTYTSIKKIDYVVVNKRMLNSYYISGRTSVPHQTQVVADEEELKKQANKVIMGDFIDIEKPSNHDSKKLAKAILKIL